MRLANVTSLASDGLLLKEIYQDTQGWQTAY